MAQGGSFVYLQAVEQAVEHNRKKMTFFPGLALDFFIHLTKVSVIFVFIFTFLFDFLCTLPFKFKLCPFLTIGTLSFILSLH